MAATRRLSRSFAGGGAAGKALARWRTPARSRASGGAATRGAASAGALGRAPALMAWAGEVDVMLANAEEAAVLGETPGVRELVIKRGSGGASWTDGERTIHVPAGGAEVRDTTGAGDAFAAGFLSAWPGSPESALERATALAERAVGLAGGRPG